MCTNIQKYLNAIRPSGYARAGGGAENVTTTHPNSPPAKIHEPQTIERTAKARTGAENTRCNNDKCPASWPGRRKQPRATKPAPGHPRQAGKGRAFLPHMIFNIMPNYAIKRAKNRAGLTAARNATGREAEERSESGQRGAGGGTCPNKKN